MTFDVLRMVKEKHRKYKKFRRLKTEETKAEYRVAKTRATSATRAARKIFENRIANNIKENPKEFFSYCKSKTTPQGEVAVITKMDGTCAENPKEIAEAMLVYMYVFSVRV